MDMGPKPGTVGNYDAFIFKYDVSGTAIWARWIGGDGIDDILGISATPDGIYITGSANGVLTPVTGLSSEVILDMGNQSSLLDAFVMKYDTSGTAIWGRWIGGTRNDQGLGISATTDTNGVSSVYVTGFASSILVETTHLSNHFITTMGVKPSTTTNNTDAFILKFNTVGEAVWGRWIGGDGLDRALGISAITDTNGVSIYVTGRSSGALTHPESILSDMGTKPGGSSNDAFIIKYDGSGTSLWGRWIGGDGSVQGIGISATTEGENGVSSLYVTGISTSNLVETPGLTSDVLTTMGTKPGVTLDAFVIKYDTSGNAVWGRWIGGPDGSSYTNGISVTTEGLYVIGYATGALSQPTSILSNMGTKPGGSDNDTFIINYDTVGNAVWGRWIGGTGNDEGLGISAITDTNGISSLFVIGRSNGNLSHPESMVTKPGGTGANQDAFIIKYV